MKNEMSYKTNVEDTAQMQVGIYVVSGDYQKQFFYCWAASVFCLISVWLLGHYLDDGGAFLGFLAFIIFFTSFLLKPIVKANSLKNIKKTNGNIQETECKTYIQDDAVNYESANINISFFITTFETIKDWKSGLLCKFTKAGFLFIPEHAFKDTASRNKWKYAFLNTIKATQTD